MAEVKKKTEIDSSIPSVSNPYNEEMVVIELFKDNKDYKDDLFVSRNGYNYQIKRGVKVAVPLGIAEIIQNSIDMDQRAAMRIEQLSKSK